MPTVILYPGDNRLTLRRLIDEGVKVQSVVCDPPYVMQSVIDRFSSSKAKAAQHGKDGALARSSNRFIGKTWDASDIAWQPDFWHLVMEIMVPGAFCFAFAGPRTFDRQTAAMRDAGMVIYPIHAWGYSTGLAKGHPSPRGKGWVFGAAAPKVDFEPIILAMKPVAAKTFKENIETFGAGDLNIAIRDDGKYPSSIIFHPKSSADDRDGSRHPTVKPIALMQYLIRHITPPGGTVLDPFAGSGTTAEAAQREGFDCILMEAEPEYVEFLEKRFKIGSGSYATESHPYLELLGIHLSSA